MKSFVLYTVALLALGFATLATSSETDEMLEDCNITKETDEPLRQCLEYQTKRRLEEIAKIRSQSVKNYDGLRLLSESTNQCFTEGEMEKQSCYMSAFSLSLLQEIHVNYISFPADATVLYQWFRMSMMTILDTCGFNRDNSSKVGACINAFDRAAHEIMDSKIIDIHETKYEAMLDEIRGVMICYGHVERAQAQCVDRHVEVLKMKTAEDFQQQQELMRQRLEACEISHNIIKSVTDCIKPLDGMRIDLFFLMLRNPRKFSEFLRLRTQRENCIQQYSEVMQCRDAMTAMYTRTQSLGIFDPLRPITQQPMNMDIEE